MSFIQCLAWLIAVTVCVPLVILTSEILCGLRPLARPALPSTLPRVAILVPAHDEAPGIVATVHALRAEAGDAARIVVVADNCADDTAALARAAGAEVIERYEPDRAGKGYALDFGRDHLAVDPPEVVVVIDADCAFGAGSLAPLAAAAAASGMPAQAVNLISPDRAAAPLVQISSFAFMLKNRVRARGVSRLGGVALMTGTGMAFPWRVFAAVPLATGDIVEDLGLGLKLARTGVRPLLLEAAQVRSAAAAAGEMQQQRRRWEHGFLATARREAPGLLGRALVERSRAQFVLGLHLLVPPLALLIAITVAGVALLAGAQIGSGVGWGPALAVLVALIAAILSILVVWGREGRAWLAPSALLRAPLYVLRKIPLYGRFLIAPETRWHRTGRERER